ncbi:MAG: succinate dehydrogenase/fumarate reductase iron-sulfur subunit [Deltaproteobacteria bacterium]|nr:succinate dehydrogenase/fumarate reductase iron-sulfur subunit [Deltaproteobacteria bacterium]
MQTTFKVYRFDPEQQNQSHFMTYAVDLPDAATVVDALTHIRDEQDPSLAFRATCERGACGDCALRVNKKGVLGCTAKIAEVMGKDRVVTVEPIRNVPVLKDLVYDMETFLWSKLKAVTPWIAPRATAPEDGNLVFEVELAPVRKAMSCVMCGLCDEGCTVVAVDDQFVGPAALTKAYRTIFDPRDSRHLERLAEIGEPQGIWDCAHCFEANGHCPIGIEPTDRIFDIRDEAIRQGVRSGKHNPKVRRHYDSFVNSVKKSGWLDEGRLAIESEGLFNVSGLLKLLPTAARAIARHKAPIPYLHHRRPGAKEIRQIVEKAEEKKP